MKILTLDIGGTFIKSALVENAKVSQLLEHKTNAHFGGASVVNTVIDIIKTYKGYERIGISTAGQIDSVQGVVQYAGQNIPNYTGTKLKDILTKQFAVPVAVENDVNAAALGECYFGAGQEYDNFLCLTYGTGVGGAIVMDKKIYKGASFAAGEFGGILIHPEDKVAGDKFSGCYEQYASTTALVEKAKKHDNTLIDGKIIFSRIQEQQVKEIVDAWIQEVVYGLVTLTHIFNPECIILGGGIMAQQYIVDKIQILLYDTIIDSFADVKIRGAFLKNTAGLLGAYIIAQAID